MRCLRHDACLARCRSNRYELRPAIRLVTRACPFKGILNSQSAEDFPFRPFPDGKPYRLLLGLRHPDGPWLDPDEDDEVVADELRQRAKHIQERRDAVIQQLDEPLAAEAGRELLEQLLRELPERHPTRFRLQGARLINLLTGEVFDTADPRVDPLEVAGRVTQEDFCLLAPGDGDDGAYRLIGGVVAFPAHWSMAEKLGKTLPQIHAPVPRWRSDAAHLVHSFMSRLAPPQPRIRWNWTLLPTAELHLSRFYTPPPAPHTAPPDDTTGIEHLHLRLERQMFHRLPRSGAVVFTIRTYQQPLARAVRDRPLVAAALAGALRDLPHEHLQYKSDLHLRLPALLAFLDEAAAGPVAVAAVASVVEAPTAV
ncbi:hypothetical protein GPECTOR_2g936 [Gonium pectorale]|uniref:DUF3445 domain-containing protein n=1 Tax=Gonium pectorale TaxID=33097 RepID=A0A150H1W7_GONPE|nr:hypothetical protein GPECTOR_2g936 [Gonium pectorale]|eukprot:KXZ56054.1 hypothetical protein GPECTOR_2g936 [Gonium pectorale]